MTHLERRVECEAARRHGLGRARQRVRATKGLNDRDKKIGRRSSKCGKGNAEAATRRRGGRKKGWNKTKPAPVEDTSGRHKWKTQVEDTSAALHLRRHSLHHLALYLGRRDRLLAVRLEPALLEPALLVVVLADWLGVRHLCAPCFRSERASCREGAGGGAGGGAA